MSDSSKKDNRVKQYSPKFYRYCDISNSTISDFRHSQLEYVSGKNGQFDGTDFSYAVMTDCYFHNASFTNCRFIGTKMYRCNFRGASFENCRFDYVDANETRISTSEVLGNMPDFPNVGREIAQVMRRNATSLGDVAASRKFVLYELEQRKEHIRRALRGEGDYYRKKYNTFWKNISLRWSGFLLNADSFIWGHGERIWRLFFSAALLISFMAAIACWSWWQSNQGADLKEVWTVFWQMLGYYTSFFLSVDSSTTLPRLIVIEWVLAAARLLMIGMLISALFRWLSHR